MCYSDLLKWPHTSMHGTLSPIQSNGIQFWPTTKPTIELSSKWNRKIEREKRISRAKVSKSKVNSVYLCIECHPKSIAINCESVSVVFVGINVLLASHTHPPQAHGNDKNETETVLTFGVSVSYASFRVLIRNKIEFHAFSTSRVSRLNFRFFFFFFSSDKFGLNAPKKNVGFHNANKTRHILDHTVSCEERRNR